MPPADVLRPPVEVTYAHDLTLLSERDTGPIPPGWRMSPRTVVDYLCGTTLPSGVVLRPKYLGQRSQIELAVAALTTDRALLLTGPSGCGKSWLAEHLAAAVSGDSSLVIQGTSGTREDALRYGWNYARLIAEGPSRDALVPGPLLTALETGRLVRVEELTRLPTELQDSLVSVLTEKAVAVPELNAVLRARQGFNLIATANLQDQGIYPVSQALLRRFCVVKLSPPAALEDEVEIVLQRLRETRLHDEIGNLEREAERVVTIFRELRAGKTVTGELRFGTSSGSLSVAEVIDVLREGIALAVHFGSNVLKPTHLAPGLHAAVVKDESRDGPVWQDYCSTALAHRRPWNDLKKACLAAQA